MKKIVLTLFAFSALFPSLFSGQALFAQEPAQQEEGIVERLDRQISETIQRLDLTDVQTASLTPILKESASQRVAVLEKYKIIPSGERDANPTRKEMRALQKEMKKITSETNDSVSVILSDTQMTEYLRIQSEYRQKMRERAKQSRAEAETAKET